MAATDQSERSKLTLAQCQTNLDGVLLGTTVGDALGLPAENLSPRRARRLWKADWKMRFLFGRGMISDDTEHTLMLAQALLSNPDDANDFQRALAWKFRWWLLGLPGGVGLATAKACLKLWLGFPASRSGVRSGGSGPAMRSAILGAFFNEDAQKRRAFVLASSRLTHRGWQAETAALAVAEATASAVTSQGSPDTPEIIETLRACSGECEWQNCLSHIEAELRHRHSVSEFACTLGLENGVTGYSLHVVPVALYAWLRHEAEFRTATIAALQCGGDTDTVGAIVGALCGASRGAANIPKEWIDRVVEWPRSIQFIKTVARALAEQKSRSRPVGEVGYFWPGLLLRNLLFLSVVCVHGFRRLLPPY